MKMPSEARFRAAGVAAKTAAKAVDDNLKKRALRSLSDEELRAELARREAERKGGG